MRRARRALAAFGALTIGVALAGCAQAAPPASPQPSPPITSGSSGTASASPVAGSAAAGSAAAPTVAVGSPTVGPYGLAIDPSLLGVLPATLGDLPVSESPDVEAPVLQDRDLPKHATGYAGAMVGDVGGSDWATASVVRLTPDSSTDAYYTAWRSDYDSAACEQAGGIESRDSLQVTAGPVDHVTCAGGVDLYHVFLRDRGEIVSITSLGELDLGRQLVRAIRP